MKPPEKGTPRVPKGMVPVGELEPLVAALEEVNRNEMVEGRCISSERDETVAAIRALVDGCRTRGAREPAKKK